MMVIWLVVTGRWLDYDFPETIGNVMLPFDEVHHFQRGCFTTTNQVCLKMVYTLEMDIEYTLW